ncbi:serine hydrolase domain-containing protein [Sungkyunkwania multivorans]|uniref:Serine hydrolase domain-containing protein n=1 Tax=Sungkyunkwania multivorans TaxID=1173618 RepID=A0ABW3D2B2_9FLAO
MMKFQLTILFIVLTLGLCSCSSESLNTDVEIQNPNTELYFPPIDNDQWETISPMSLGWNTEAIPSLYDFLEEKDTKGFIVLKDGRIVLEKYFNGATASDNNPWNSIGKSLTSFVVGIAQQENHLNIYDTSSDYLGEGWSALTPQEEQAITIWNHITMTTGLDYNTSNINCTDTDCLTYLNPAGEFWFYHNAPYTLTRTIVEAAVGQNFNDYYNNKVRNRIGMQGTWLSIGYANIYYSNARSLARFGLLNLNKGRWGGEAILDDTEYFSSMISSSQDLNKAYGYLWWLNGKENYRVPGLASQFTGPLIPSAPDDLYAGLGKDDQKLYIVPSEDLVIVRMGDDGGQTLLGPSSFDELLWQKLNAVLNR